MTCGYRSGGPGCRDRASCEEPLCESLCTELRPGAAPRKGCTATFLGPDSASDVGGALSARALSRGSSHARKRRREHGPDRDTPHGDRGRGPLAVAGVRYTAVSTHPSTPAEVWERRQLPTTGPLVPRVGSPTRRRQQPPRFVVWQLLPLTVF